MVVRGADPWPQEVLERLKHLGSSGWVALENLPFLRSWTPFLLQDLRWDGEFANVVEQGSPAEAVQFRLRQSHLRTDHLGVGTNPLHMTTGQPVVPVELGDELDGLSGCLSLIGWQRHDLAAQLPG